MLAVVGLLGYEVVNHLIDLNFNVKPLEDYFIKLLIFYYDIEVHKFNIAKKLF